MDDLLAHKGHGKGTEPTAPAFLGTATGGQFPPSFYLSVSLFFFLCARCKAARADQWRPYEFHQSKARLLGEDRLKPPLLM